MLLIEEIYQSFKNRTRPNIRWKMVGDMYRRMDYIQQTFQGIETITEFGPFQGCSTAAWLMLKPKTFITIDAGVALDVELYKKAAAEIKVDFKFIISNDLETTINPCELLFIDTMHTEEHTYNELRLHADKVSKYLVFHDVAEPRFGTYAGIRKWWKDYPEWHIKYHDNDDCGFLVLEK